MPIAAIPFKSPAPFELPDAFLEPFRTADAEGVLTAVIDLLAQVDSAEWYASALVSAGQLVPGPVRAQTPELGSALEQAATPFLLDSPIGREHFLGRAVHAGSPLLLMGELVAGEDNPFPEALDAALRAGADRAQLGFCYAFPLLDGGGQVRGAVALRRSLEAGPLNHDQPAIAAAAMQAAGTRLGELAGA